MPRFESTAELDAVPTHNPIQIVGELIQPGRVDVKVPCSHAPAPRDIESRDILKRLFRIERGQLVQRGPSANSGHLQVRVHVAEPELIHHVRTKIVCPGADRLLNVGQAGFRPASDVLEGQAEAAEIEQRVGLRVIAEPAQGQAIPSAQVVVALQQILMVIHRFGERAEEPSIRRVRAGQEIRELQSHRVQAVRRDLLVRERLIIVIRVANDGHSGGRREIASFFRFGGWETAGRGTTLADLEPLARTEEEQLVLQHRPATGEPELILVEKRHSRQKEAPRSKIAVPVEFPGGTVNFVRAGLGDDVHDAAGISAVLGGVVAGDEPELRDGVRVRIIEAGIQLGSGELPPIQIVLGHCHAIAIDRH